MSKHKNYEFYAEDHWKGFFSIGTSIWPEKKSKLLFRYATNTFDSQVEFLDGEKKGLIAGQQSWKYYEK